METMEIDFKRIDGPVYSGRPRGESLRSEYNLDNIDASPSVEVSVRIPESTYSITSSFFLGFFGPSVLKAGSKDAFFRKYHFQAKPVFQEAFTNYVERALQAKNLFSRS